MKTDATRKTEIEARIHQLKTRIHGIAGALEEQGSKDWEELAVEREGDEVLEDLGLAAQDELRGLDAALKRLAAGEYGYCATCGVRVAEERLDLLPATPFCAAHAGKH